MMGALDWLFRRSLPSVPPPPCREQERRRQERQRAEDDRVREWTREQIRALDERMERIAREFNG